MAVQDVKTELYRQSSDAAHSPPTLPDSFNLENLATPSLEYHDCLLDHHKFASARFPEHWFLRLFSEIKHLGSGGLGLVFEARHTMLDRPVAIKIPNSNDPESIRNFMHEAKITALLSHDDKSDSTLKIFSAGTTTCELTDHFGNKIKLENIPYIEMELLEGKTLKDEKDEIHNILLTPDKITFRNKIDTLLRVNISEVCRALCQAHRNSIVHRDITPSNILTQSERTRIIDWGLAARIDRNELESHLAEKVHSKSIVRDPLLGSYGRGRIAGTPAYMPPELLDIEHPVDPRSDVYSLGAVIYELLTNKYCINAKDQNDFFHAIGKTPIIPPIELNSWVPRDLSNIIMKTLEYEPTKRYQSMGEFERALQGYLYLEDSFRI